MASDGYILGLSALAHDPAAALLDPRGEIIAIEESKMARSRDAAGIPREAIRYCFDHAGIDWSDVSSIAVASEPRKSWRRSTGLRLRQAARAPVSSGYYLSKSVGELGRELNNFRILRFAGRRASGPRDRFGTSHVPRRQRVFRVAFRSRTGARNGRAGRRPLRHAAIGEGTKLRVDR